MKPGHVIALGILVAAAAPLAAQEENNAGKEQRGEQSIGDADHGRKMAQKHCSRCHVVGEFNEMGGISSTPSFELLVRRRDDYIQRFTTFFDRPPHPAFISVKGVGRPHPHLPPNAEPVQITYQDILDIAAFVKTLEPETDKPDKPLVYSPRPKPKMR